MTITELVAELLEVRRTQGDIEVVGTNGKPLTFVAVDEKKPSGAWTPIVKASD